jgi:hypothetical protein
MDILVYAAKKNINDLNTCINTYVPTTFYQGCFDAAKTSANDGTLWTANSGLYSNYQKQGGTSCFWSRPWCTGTWTNIPTLPGGTTCTAGTNPATSAEYLGFKVCSTNLYGSTPVCTWTVPAGTSIARFQIWGAGGRSGSGCCCGGSTWGQNGAYASIIIPVTPGCQYTLTAACGCAIPVCWGQNYGGRSDASSVTGYGLCNFCAMSGTDANHWCFMAYDQGVTQRFSGCCRWSTGDCFAAGGCICNGQSDYCHSSCSTCGCINRSCSNTTKFYGCSTLPYVGSAEKLYGSQVAGIVGLNGGMCFNTSHYGCAIAAPIYGFHCTSSGGETVTFNNGQTCGGLFCNHAANNFRRHPGAGGTVTIMMGGCTLTCDPSGCITACGGDIGRNGMVCVTYA